MKKFASMFLMVLLVVSCITSVFAMNVYAGTSLNSWIGDLPGGKLYIREGMFFGVNGSSDVYISTGIAIDSCMYDAWINLPAKSSYSVLGAGLIISTRTLVATTSCYTDAGTMNSLYSPTVPRNIGVSYVVEFATGYVNGQVKLEGYDQFGIYRYETILCTSTLITYGNIAWSQLHVASATITHMHGIDWAINPAANAVQLNIGTGDKIGFTGKVQTLHYVSEDFVRKALTTYTISPDYWTWTPTNVPNDALDYVIGYRYRVQIIF